MFLLNEVAVLAQEVREAADELPLAFAVRGRRPPRDSGTGNRFIPQDALLPPHQHHFDIDDMVRVEPMRTAWDPAASTPSIPPIVVTAVFDGSGGK